MTLLAARPQPTLLIPCRRRQCWHGLQNKKEEIVAKVQPDDTKGRQSDDSDSPGKPTKIPFNLGGVLGGLGGLIEKLGELAEAGEKLSQSGEFEDAGGKLRGVYGINVKTGLGDQGQQELKVEPFGNVRPQPAGKPPEEDAREPLVDIHEEKDHLLVLVELPGVDKENVTLELADDRLNLSAQRGKTSYRKEVTLPERFSEEDMRWECKNGILQIRFER
ncbi:MAG: Hsp20/alpha crystallin family protein [Planctomycetes bacterium]|nr:Hsp20/alpha crystallin family protein [Planctomycetota bacterium]